MKPSPSATAAILLLGLWPSFTGCAPADDPVDSVFTMTTERGTDVIALASNGASFTVTSQTGIGAGTIELEKGKWMAPLTIGFQLNGLESLTLEYTSSDGKKVKQRISIASQSLLHDASLDVRQYLFVGGNETPMAADSPQAVAVSYSEIDNQPVIHVALSKHFMDTQPGSLSIRWIDFYR